MKLTNNKTLCVMLFFLVFLNGCAKCTDCGKIVPSNEVTALFNASTVVPEYNYYSFRPDDNPPLAIMGLLKKYTVKSSFWVPIDISEEQLKKWTVMARRDNNNYDDYYQVRIDYRGSKVIAPDGEQVGVYYSTLKWTVLRFKEENVIELYRPQPSATQKNMTRRYSFFPVTRAEDPGRQISADVSTLLLVPAKL